MSTNEVKCIKVAFCVSFFGIFLVLSYINLGGLDISIRSKMVMFLIFFSLIMLSLQTFTILFGLKDTGSFQRIDHKFKSR